MYTARWQTEENVTRFNFFAGNHFAFIYNTNAETSDVIFTFGIEACHFSSFAANQSATGFFTSICNTFNDVSNFLRINFIYSNIVKEEQRFCTLYQNIVNAHSNCVLTNGIVFVSHESQFQFGTNAVSTGNQNGFFIFSNVQSEQTAKATQVTDNFGTIGSANAIFHQFYCFITSINVNAGISISKLFLFFAHVILLFSARVLFSGLNYLLIIGLDALQQVFRLQLLLLLAFFCGHLPIYLLIQDIWLPRFAQQRALHFSRH